MNTSITTSSAIDYTHAARIELTRHLVARSNSCPVVFDRARIPMISALLARTCWWLPSSARELIADIGLTIFAFDDLVDEHDLEIDELEFRCRQLTTCARGLPCPELGFDPTANILAGVATGLGASCEGAGLERDWTETMSACLQAIVDNRRLADESGELSLDAYLEVGRDSVGVIPVGLAVAVLVGGERAANQRDVLMTALRHAATAVRLANDLRTFEREQDERTTNALMLAGVDAESLARRARAERDAAARVLAGAELGPCGQFVLEFTDTLISLYDLGDFRGHDHCVGQLKLAS